MGFIQALVLCFGFIKADLRTTESTPIILPRAPAFPLRMMAVGFAASGNGLGSNTPSR